MVSTSFCQIPLTGQTMDIKFTIFSTLLLISGVASGSEVQHGIIEFDGAGHVVLVVADPLEANQVVYFQFPDAKQQPLCCKRLIANDFVKTDGENTLATNDVTGNPPLVYRARIPKLWAEIPFVGAATVGRKLQAHGVNGLLVTRTKQGQTSQVKTCTSQEGVHLIDRKGSTETTHLYLGLGYDIEQPSCK